MMDPIYKKLEDAVKAIGAAGGYTYVFDLNRTDIPYIDENVSKMLPTISKPSWVSA